MIQGGQKKFFLHDNFYCFNTYMFRDFDNIGTEHSCTLRKMYDKRFSKHIHSITCGAV